MVVILGPGASAAASGHRRAVDWTVAACSAVLDAEVVPLAGEVGALLAAPLRADRECYVTRAKVTFRSSLIELLARTDGDAVIVVDRRARRGDPDAARSAAERVCLDDLGRVTRIGAASAGARFAGIARLSPRAVACLLASADRDGGSLAQAAMPELLRALLAHGLEVRAVERDGDWVELDGPQDLARFVLGTKAESLERLRPLVRQCTIGRQVRCHVAEWRAAPAGVRARVTACFGARPLAVRSSSRSEDGWTTSRAGQFTSVLGVAPEPAALGRAIDDVIASYGPGAEDHQILIQEMLDSVALSGVVFTRTLIHGMPYYTINYDDTTTRTGCVTSGTGKHLRTVVVHRSVASDPAPDHDRRLVAVLRAARELEELVGHDALDIEFALDRQGVVHIQQVRPIVIGQSVPAALDDALPAEAPDEARDEVSDAALDAVLAEAGARLARAQVRGPGLVGRHAYFGVMPDWNPAEIIGTRPRRLALGLYQYLVTDEIWAVQRAECGYRDVRPNPLLITLAGHPYIDIRVSLNSFVPAALDDELAGRLVDHYLERLRAQPHLHDKIEFEVAFTCLAFDFDRRARDQLRPAGFTASDIDRLRDGLRGVTREILGRTPRDLAVLGRLEARRHAILQRPLGALERAHALLEDCRALGTPPFAHLARGAFVAITLLRSLTAIGVLDPEHQAAFLNSLDTVARGFERDGGHVAAGRLPWAELVDRYRHLRPGTYEITSPSYGDEPERYLRPATLRAPGPDATPATPVLAGQHGTRAGWSDATRRAVAHGLRRLGLPDSVTDFERFLRATIEGREWSKFVFTRNLSQALDDLARFAAQHGLDRDQASHMDLADLDRIRTGACPGDIGRFLAARVDEARRAHHLAICAQLPSLVFEPHQLRAFERFSSQPNFVTSKRVIAPPIELSRARQAGRAQADLGGRLVLVPQADPGYDWLFGHPLAGLITMFGGANSHLAIRAAEANLPAAIGVGETLYERLTQAHVLEMDCAGQQIRLIQ